MSPSEPWVPQVATMTPTGGLHLSDGQFRKTVQYAAAYDADHMNRGFDMPTPTAAGQHVGDHRCKTAV